MVQDKGPVVVTLSCEAHPSTETHEIDRAEWDAMTPGHRLALLDDMVATHMANAGGGGWAIEDPEDEAAVSETVPDPLRELAEWLVSLKGKPVTRAPRTTDIAEIITRAREALGRTK